MRALSDAGWIVRVSTVVAAGILGAAPHAAAPATHFNVTTTGQSAYVINGVISQTLTLTRGETYTFSVLGAGHPFWITTALGASNVADNQWVTGITNNGVSPGTITFVVPESAPSTLYYQCEYHQPMNGRLNIVSPDEAGDAPLPLWALGALAAGLAAMAIGAQRRKRDSLSR